MPAAQFLQELISGDKFNQDLSPRPAHYTALVAFAIVAYVIAQYLKPKSKVPTAIEDKSIFSWKSRLAYVKDAKQVLADATQKFSGPFKVLTEDGSIVMMPPETIDAINASKDLTFVAYVKNHWCSELDTFRTFRPPPEGLFDEAVMKGLTRALPKYTKALSMQMKDCLETTWGDSQEWREADITQDILGWVAKLSSRIFLGPTFSENKEWIDLNIKFTVKVFMAVTLCRFIPWPLRYPVERFLPLCRDVRRDFRTASRILSPVLKARHAEIAAAEKEGRKPNLPDDSIEWLRNASHGRKYEEVDLQIALQLAAIHTTSDLLCQTLLDLCAHPEMFEPLRQEAIEVLSKYGWKKIALTELRLLDSVFKETQRQKPIALASMHREAIKDVDLGNGIVIRKGEQIAVSAHQMWAADHYENPEEYDGFRFVKRRKIAGLENRSLLVSTSNDHLGFSHGKHACPGRFFAANEVKIAAIHLLLKYDMKIADPSVAKHQSFGINLMTNPKARISFRRRKAEIDLDNLAFED